MTEEHWDAYLTTIDGQAASVLVNLAHLNTPPQQLGWLHQWALPMRDPGDNGLGSVSEAQGFEAVEEEVSERLGEAGFVLVGRERSAGAWKLSYYASAQREADLRAHIEAVFGAVAQRVATGVVEDSDWSYYFDVLCPDAQEGQWMRDRDKILELRQQGEVLGQREAVHYCYFSDEESVDVFVNEAKARGFECEAVRAEETGLEYPWMVTATRTDFVELAEFHVVVMQLYTLAEDCGGEYDVWELS